MAADLKVEVCGFAMSLNLMYGRSHGLRASAYCIIASENFVMTLFGILSSINFLCFCSSCDNCSIGFDSKFEYPVIILFHRSLASSIETL